ncbi:MAG: Calx-beta domain-containing protein [Geminicoccaceae bacterium]
MRGTQADGTDTLANVEYARFADRTVSLGDLTSPTLSLAAADASKAEGTGGSTAYTFTVTRDGNPYQAASVDWAVSGAGSSPANAADFVGGTLPGGTLSFAAGETSKTITVNVLGDSLFEANESFAVTLSRASGATIATASAAGTIQNDDAPPSLSIAALSADKAEGSGTATDFTFTVTRSGDSSMAVSAAWAASGSGSSPANAADFVGGALPFGLVSFAAGETSKTITVSVVGDYAYEASEGFTVTLASPTGGATIANAAATGTIQNDDGAPTLAIAAANADRLEGNAGTTDFTFTVTRSGDTSTAASASWSVNGSGVNPADGADFAGGVLPSGTVSFAAGETSRTITVSVLADGTYEPSEGFAVTLSSPVGATIATTTAYGTIQNDDPSGPVPIVGDDLANTLYGTAGADVIQGLGGDDRLYGYGGDDRLEGGSGNDIIEPGFGNDTVYGGIGTDKVSYYNDAGTAGLVIDLRTDIATRGAETDRLYDVEDIDGGRGNDTIDGDDGANYLSGADGNDVVRAWGGNDTLRGGIGDDVLEPGAGVDTVYGGPGTDKVSYYNETGTAGVTIDLTAGTAVRSGETDTLYEIENADGTRNADTIYGSAAVNVLSGADGNDVLYGRAGNDTLLGSGGNDRLLGEAGKDVLTGGAGVDMFDFDRTGDSAWTSGKTACDRITDFAHLTDKIDLSTIDAKSATAVNDTFTFLAAKGAAITAVGQVHWYQAGGNTYIEANTGGSTAPEIQIQLDGLKTITAADFVL